MVKLYADFVAAINTAPLFFYVFACSSNNKPESNPVNVCTEEGGERVSSVSEAVLVTLERTAHHLHLHLELECRGGASEGP